MMDFFNEIAGRATHLNINMILFLGIILFGGAVGGRLFQRLKVPQVVGYIIIGVILGQSGLKFIGLDMIKTLEPVSTIALSLIGFSIGGELKIAELKKRGKQFVAILFLEALTAFIVVAGLVFGLVLILTGNFNMALALGLVLGAISSATAPAATTDVLWENRTRGPLTSTVLGIVAMDDAVALLLFAFSVSIANNLLGSTASGGAELSTQLLSLLWEIGGAIVAGALISFILSKLIKGFLNEDRILAFSLGAIMLLSGLSVALNLDMILAAMSMGFFISNFAPRKSSETFSLVQKFSPPIYVLFFVLVGSKLNIWNITGFVAAIAGVFLFGRTFGKLIGAKAGAAVSKAPKTVGKYLPFCLLSQAGVAIGLSIVAGQVFTGEFGNLVVTVVTATTFVVQILGPIAVKYAVDKAGETGLNITEEDLVKQSTAADIMYSDIPQIPVNAPVSSILEIFSENDVLCYPVVYPDGKLAGIISIDDLKNTFMAAELSDFLLAHDIMKKPVASCTVSESAEDARNLLKRKSIEYLPVFSPDAGSGEDGNGKFAGIIDERGIQLFFSRKIAELNHRAEELG
ncbi:MAG: cation:proton antiporter [Spirochaetales bacterium]|uniref:Cation:proton antiporter n=1 Tax=Candidatus Thalassospirochaeta sargassi TaxID=3119039 RepID=A0AAJ1ID87_9SPIO|nr:cation:proton antiporter [Spirochaetales bacterium]